MTYDGHIENGKIVFDEPADLPDGARVRVEVDLSAPADVRTDRPTLLELLSSVIGRAEGLPEDWSENHDRYLREEHSR